MALPSPDPMNRWSDGLLGSTLGSKSQSTAKAPATEGPLPAGAGAVPRRVRTGRSFPLLFHLSDPRTGPLTRSPHLSELSINSQGAAAPANAILTPNLSPDAKQASPLVSPLPNDQACPRTDDEEDGRRKVGPRRETAAPMSPSAELQRPI